MAWNVVIAGAGFAGAYAARELERLLPRQSTRLTVVNDVNFLLYAPFLPEAAAGTLEPRHVVTPLRDILRRSYLRLGAITGHDPEARSVEITDHDDCTEAIPYDQLVLAVGSVSRALPIPGLTEHAIGFKSLADAIWLRNHLIETLEAANATEDEERRGRLLTYVFVGGGYSGLEALAELQDFAAQAMDRYPRARLQGMRWILVEAADRVLTGLPQPLADYATTELRGRGIEVLLDTRLEEVGDEHVVLSTGERVPTETVVWTAGVRAHPSLRNLSVPLDDTGRVPVDRYLRVEGAPNVWAIGDCAAVPDPDGGICPPTAQHAVRQGKRAGRNVAATLGVGQLAPFDYRSRGMFVNLGRYRAAAMTGDRTFSGPLAWWMARTYHMSQIPGFGRKVRAVIDWTASLPFGRDLSELGSLGHPKPLADSVYERGGSHRPVG